MTEIEKTISQKLQQAFQPIHYQLINESPQHNVPAGSAMHFKLIIVSDQFNGLGLVKRHQAIYQILSEELAGQVHALSIQAHTPDEWQSGPNNPDSPACRGGFGQ